MQPTTLFVQALRSALAGAAVLAAVSNAGADTLDCSDLFLAPQDALIGGYPRLEISAGLAFASDGLPIVDVRIVPPEVLPGSDPFACGDDYEAELSEGVALLTFHRPGPYFVRYERIDGTVDGYVFGVDTRFREDGGCGAGPATEIPCGAPDGTPPDVAIVSSELGFDHTWGDTGTEASTIAEARAAILAAYAANGNQPVHVVIDAHGSPGEFTIGDETVSAENVAELMEGLEGKIASLTLLACSVASGDVGEDLICKLEQGLGCDVTGYTGSNSDTVESPAKWYTEGDAYSWERGDGDGDADLDDDGDVDGADLGLLLGEWGETSSFADLNGDDMVNGADLGIMLGQWGDFVAPLPCPGDGTCCEPNGSPGCDDADCCAGVCAADSFCCNIAWDIVCADQARQLCPQVCPGNACGDTFLTQSFGDDLTPGMGVACTTDGVGADNAWARTFDLSSYPSLTGNLFMPTCVELGVEFNSSADIDATFTLYLDLDGGAPIAPGIDLQPILSMPLTIPAGTSDTMFTLPLPPAPALAGSSLMVAELSVPAQTEGVVWPGSNAAGANGETFIRSTGCGVPNFVPLSQIGFPDSHWVMHVRGEILPGGGGHPNCPAGGDCFTPHAGGGCDDAACCNTVCELDPGCCDGEWDQQCVNFALAYCGGAAIFQHDPEFVQNDSQVLIEGDGFPLDPFAMNVYFMAESGAKIPVEIVSVVDLDDDGDAELIEGFVNGIFDSELGMTLQLHVELAWAQPMPFPAEPQALFLVGNADDPPILLSPQDSQGDEDEASTVSNRGRVNGQFEEGANGNELLNTYKLPFTADSWAANSTYTLGIQFHVRYRDTVTGKVKREKYSLNGSKIVTPAAPTAAGCLDAIAAKMNALINIGATSASRATIFSNFEWVRVGNCLELKKKAGSPANIRLVDYGGKTKKPVVTWKKD